MRTQTTIRTLYTYDELDEEAKAKALETLWNVNVDYEWWECICDDAERAQLKITGFDLHYGTISYEPLSTVRESRDAIIKDHGKNCDTYKLAQTMYRVKLDEDIEQEYWHDLGECYLSILRNDYEYQTSREQIKDTIRANEYEFTEDGDLA